VNGVTLPKLPAYAKVMLTGFLIVMGFTYLVGVAKVWNKTGFTVQGVIENERGSEEKMIYAKELPDMLSVTHYHIGGWAMMFFLVLGIFMFSTYSPGIKLWLAWPPFLLALCDAGSMWLVRYVSTGFAVPFMIVGFLMASFFGLTIILSLANIWLGRARAE
jgi:hypothetical protein